MSALKHQQSSQSFYSVYSHDSVFDTILESSPEPKQFPQIERNQQQFMVGQVKMLRMAQSSINLDDCQLDVNQSSSKSSHQQQKQRQRPMIEQRKSFETIMTYKGKNKIEQPQSAMQVVNEIYDQKAVAKVQQNIDEHQISEIFHKDEKGQQSICLLRQIDCLSVEQVSPQELKDIKKKIETLKKQQFSLQNQLGLASELLKTAKIRNTILEEQVAKYKLLPVASPTPTVSTTKVANINNPSTFKQSRQFIQHSSSSLSPQLQKLKFLYKQCSLKQSYCVYQNEGYKIQVMYQREKNLNQPKILIFILRLTPYHHVVARKQFKFCMQIRSKDNTKQQKQSSERLEWSYDGAMIMQQYSKWPQSKFHIQLAIHEMDQLSAKHHTHYLLIPLPISHFLQPRLSFLMLQSLIKFKNMMSQYSLKFTGTVSESAIEKLKQNVWWVGRFVSCIGWDEIVFVEIRDNKKENLEQQQRQQSDKMKQVKEEVQIGIQIFGKRNGQVTKGIIEFISFFLTN